MFASLPADLTFALRQLRKSPGFAITAILTLALGIGTTTGTYSLIDGVLLKPLPLPHPEQLVAVYTEHTNPGAGPWSDWNSYPNYLDWRDRSLSFSQIAVYMGDSRLVSRTNGTEGAVLPVTHVSANYFDTLGVEPMLGRNFKSDDDQPGRHVAIISYEFWQSFFARDSNTVGATLLLNDEPYTVIGIMPRGFTEPRVDYFRSAQLWTSVGPTLEGSSPHSKHRDDPSAEVVGRLKPGVTVEQARVDLKLIQSNLAKAYPEDRYMASVLVRPKLADMTGDIRAALWLLMAAVMAVLLIVCTNVAGLMLTRMMKRCGEMALRTALGASAWRVWRHLLIESIVLGLAGGAIGVAIGYGLLHIALPFVPNDIPRVNAVSIDGRVLAFTAAISILCAVVSSLAPAWKLTCLSPIDALREQSQSATGGRRSHRLQSSLVIAQTAFGFVLLLASGLLIRGFVNVRHAKLGFQSDHLLRFLLPLTDARYPDAKKALFYKELLPKLAAVPGVRIASAGYPAPLHGGYPSAPVEIDGRPNPPENPRSTLIGEAEPGYFETLGIPLLRGRAIAEADNDPKAPLVALINQSFAKQYFLNENTIGRHIRPDLTQLRNQSGNVDATIDSNREIIGVLADFKQTSVTEPPQPMAFLPYSQASMLNRPAVVLRVAGEPLDYQRAVQAVLTAMDPALFILHPEQMDEWLGSLAGTQRFETMLISGFSAIALFLTGLGLYATLSALVATRTREIGLRMAIGADRRDVALLIVSRAAALVAAGLGLGGVIAIIAARGFATADWWRTMLFDVSWLEPQTYTIILLVLCGVSGIACVLPTLRATRIDPMRVLRDE